MIKYDDQVAPVEQLQGHRVSIVVGHNIHLLIDEAQVSHQGLHHTGLLKYGVLVWPLRKTPTHTYEHVTSATHPKRQLNSLVCH